MSSPSLSIELKFVIRAQGNTVDPEKMRRIGKVAAAGAQRYLRMRLSGYDEEFVITYEDVSVNG